VAASDMGMVNHKTISNKYLQAMKLSLYL